jgi:hypothetical protein
MKMILLWCALAAGCRTVPEARVVNELPVETGVLHQFDVDTLRWKKDGASGAQRFAEYVNTHLLSVGMPTGGPAITGALVNRVKLPSPGYVLRVRIKARADDFCNVVIDLVSEPGETQVERAPFSALQAFEAVHQGISSFLPARLGPLGEGRHAKLSAQAVQLGAEGKDPPMTMVEYKRVPRPVQLVPQDEYWVPSSLESVVAPKK